MPDVGGGGARACPGRAGAAGAAGHHGGVRGGAAGAVPRGGPCPGGGPPRPARARRRCGGDAKPGAVDGASLADALVAIAESFLAEKIAAAENPDVYQVIVHASADMLPTGREVAGQAEAAAALSGDLLPEMQRRAGD